MPRLREDPTHFAGLDDLAGIHDRGAIADTGNQTEIVRYEQHGRPARASQRAEQIDDARLDRHVERRCRLIQQK